MTDFFSRIGRNLRTLLWAFALAISVWVAAVTAADPDEVRVYPTPVPVEIVGQDPSLVIRGDYPQQVEVTLRAPRSAWDQLMARPGSLRALLDLSGLSAGEHPLTFQIQVDVRPVRIVTASPSSVTLTLEALASRSLNLDMDLSGQPAIGYQAGTPALEPRQVLVSGPESLVAAAGRAVVPINLDGIREAIDQSAPVEVLDLNGQPLKGLTLNPEAAHVTVAVSQQGGFRDMAVKVVVHGQVATGYRLDNISVFPPVVTVFSSNSSLINALPGVVETQPLNLDGIGDNLTTRLELNLPQGVSIVGEQTVLIQAGVSPIESSLTLSGEKVELIGLPSGMSAQISPASVDVILSGPLPLLDTLTRQDVRVTVDVTGLGPGTHQLTPRIEILISDVAVESVLPGTVEVVLILNATPTPRP
jgi:YbbR domain-containing protein